MKNKKLIVLLICLLSALIIILSIWFSLLLINKNTFINFNASNKEILNKEYDAQFKEINIKTDAANVELQNSINNKFKVVIYGEENTISVDDDNFNLNITEEEKNCFGFCFNNKISKIKVMLPENYSNDIKIDNDYGNINIDKFDNANIFVNEDSGNVKIESVKNITAKNDYGNIEIRRVNEYLNINVDSGNVKIDSINLTKDSKIKNDYGNVLIDKTNEIYIDAKTDFGKVKVNKNYSDSNIKLKIINDCGDIKINN